MADWEQIEPLLARLLDVGEAERSELLERERARDPERVRRVEELLARGLVSDSFLESPLSHLEEGPDRAESAERTGERVGRYRLLRSLGRGGMGEVWLAERDDGSFRQRVALKLVHRGLDTEELAGRFRDERQILAWLDHPGIARLIDGGVADDGRPFLAMEFVDGEPIDAWCARRAPELRERIELFVAACDAVQHAHERGVVHRDLKPSNVLVDAHGRPRLLDFGIAKVLGADDRTELAELTRTGQRLFSPLYASPEQVRGQPVGAASDVYSLGVLLCELLTGSRPYDARTTSQLELERVVCEERPRRPSELAAPELRTRFRGDLDWIVGTCLRKEPERRYASASALAEDLRRHLAHEPVLARPDSLAYRARTFARRHRTLVAATAVVFLALTVGLVVSVDAWRTAAASDRATRREAYAYAIQAAEHALRNGDTAKASALLRGVPQDLRGWECRHLAARLDRSVARFVPDGPVTHDALAVSPDASLVALRAQGSLYLLDPSSGAARAHAKFDEQPIESGDFTGWSSVDFHPSGALVATGGRDGRLRVFATGGLELVREVDLGRYVFGVAYAPDGGRLACGLRSGEIVVLEHPGYTVVARWQAHDEGDLCLAFSEGGTRLASGSWDARVRLWDVPTLAPRGELRGHERHVTDVAFARGGELLVSISIDGTARVWDLAAPEHPSIVRPHRGSVEALALHSDGGTAFTGGFDGSIVRWDLATGETLATLRGHAGKVQSLVVAGQQVVSAGPTASTDSEVRFFPLDADDVPVLPGCEYQACLALHPVEHELLVNGADGKKRRFRLPDLVPLPTLYQDERASGGVAWLPDGTGFYALGDEPGYYEIWDLERGLVHAGTGRPGEWQQAFWLDAGRRRTCVLTQDWQLELQPWDGSPATTTVGLARRDAIDPGSQVVQGLVDGDGRYLLGLRSGEVWRIDPDDGAVDVLFTAREDARLLAARGDDLLVSWAGGGVSLWRGGERLWSQDRLGSRPRFGALHPTEPRVALGMPSGPIVLLDASNGAYVTELGGHTGAVRQLAFSADGTTLFSCSADGTTRVWTAPAVAEATAGLR